MNSELIENYKYHRNRGSFAKFALINARADLAAGKRRYTCNFSWQECNANPPRAAYGHKELRWVEHPGDLWRFTGTSADVARKESFSRAVWPTEGWYTSHDDYHETVSGVVYQLPARKGIPQYIAGYSGSWEKRAACLSFGETYESPLDAARVADRLAELMAEESREYDEAWQAGNRFAILRCELVETRRDLLETIQEAKLAAKTMRGMYPKLCETLQTSIRRTLADLQGLRNERAKLLDTFGKHAGFLEGNS